MKDSYRSRVYSLAPENGGIITIAMAESVGVPAVELRKLAARGALEREGRGVYRVPFYPVDKLSEYLAITNMVGPDAYIGGDSVLLFLDIGVSWPKKVEVVTHRRVRKETPSSVKLVKRSGPPNYTYYKGLRCEPMVEVLRKQIFRDEPTRVRNDIEEAHEAMFLGTADYEKLLGELEDFVSSGK